MKHRLGFISLLFLALAPTAMASSKWYVDGVNGSDNSNCKSPQTACKTIGHAISLASPGDSILVAAATYTENLTIGFSLRVVGSGATTTIVDGGRVNTVVTIPNANAHVILSKLTVRNGPAQSGGGIVNNGTLTISNSTLDGNSAGAPPFGGCSILCTAAGGGIWNSGTLAISNSTLSSNRAIWANGCSYCTAEGGGISNGGTLAISNSTLSSDQAECGESRCHQHGGGIYGTATLQNSIVAYSFGGLKGGSNCSGTITSKGYNLSSDGSCNFNNTGDLNNTDPKLGHLGNYGGPTQTIPLLSGSPAIDAGNPSGCTDGKGHLLKTDQRGKPRPDKEDTGGCDMGAYERQKD